MDILESVPIFVFNGIALGMIYFLIAIGLTIIFGMMGVINFAHGALYAIGAYLAYTTTLHTGNFWLSLAVAPVIMFGVGIGEGISVGAGVGRMVGLCVAGATIAGRTVGYDAAVSTGT